MKFGFFTANLGKQWQNVNVVPNAYNGKPVLIAQDPDRPVR